MENETDRIKTYLSNFDAACARHFAPGCIYDGVAGALRFAREIGYGLPDTKAGNDAVKTTYSLLVKHTFGRPAGVPVNAKRFFEEVRWAMEQAKLPAATTADLEAREERRQQHNKDLEKELDDLNI